MHWVVLGVMAAVCVAFLVLPTVFVFLASVSRDNFVTFPPSGFTLRWYQHMGEFSASVMLSLRLAVASTLISLGLGIPAALALTRSRMRGIGIIDAMLRAPLQVPYVVTGVAFLQYYFIVFRPGSALNLSGTFAGLLAAHVVICVPFVISSVVTGLSKFDFALEEAAYGLGCSRVRAVLAITLPVVRSSIAAGTFFAFITSFDNIPVSLFLNVANTSTLPVAMFFKAEFSYGPTLFAVAATVTAFSTVAVLIYDRAIGLRGGVGQFG